MTLPLFSRVILTQDILDHALLTGDIGTIVEQHPATSKYPEGYEGECFTGKGSQKNTFPFPHPIFKPS